MRHRAVAPSTHCARTVDTHGTAGLLRHSHPELWLGTTSHNPLVPLHTHTPHTKAYSPAHTPCPCSILMSYTLPTSHTHTLSPLDTRPGQRCEPAAAGTPWTRASRHLLPLAAPPRPAPTWATPHHRLPAGHVARSRAETRTLTPLALALGGEPASRGAAEAAAPARSQASPASRVPLGRSASVGAGRGRGRAGAHPRRSPAQAGPGQAARRLGDQGVPIRVWKKPAALGGGPLAWESGPLDSSPGSSTPALPWPQFPFCTGDSGKW